MKYFQEFEKSGWDLNFKIIDIINCKNKNQQKLVFKFLEIKKV